jgi:peptide alpha-N-acetyltransferase
VPRSYFLAQHYDRMGDMPRAISNIDECLQHTPTAIELYQMKSKILRHAGDINAAHAVVEHGRTLDLQDRYINNRATKYALMSDQPQKAEDTISLFTKSDGDGGTEANLFDMQVMWYELLAAESFHRKGEYGKSLKKFTAVEKHFFDIQEDQFDFHTYCIRKMTLRSYVRMLRVEDELKGHKNYVRAACGVVQCYLELYKNPPPKRLETGEIDYSHMAPADKKKAKAKARREATLKKKEEEAKKEELKRQEEEDKEKNKDKKDKKRRRPAPREVDPDPQGELLAAKPQLEEAWKYCKLLQEHCATYLQSHTTAFDVALLREKYLLCLKSLSNAHRIDSQCPQVFRRTVSFATRMLPKDGGVPAAFSDKNAVVYKVLKSELQGLLGGKTLGEYVEGYAKAHAGSMLHAVAVSEAKYIMDPSPAQETASLKSMTTLDYPKDFSDVHCEECVKGVSLKSCIEVCKTLQRVFDSEAATASLNQFKQQCKAIFPYATFFGNKAHLCTEMVVNTTAEEAKNVVDKPVV